MSLPDLGRSQRYRFCSSQLENFPDVILLKIFSFLYMSDLCKMGRVCIRWYHLTRSPVLWKSVDAHDLQLSSHQVQKLVAVLPTSVLHLRIRGTPFQRIPILPAQVAIEIRERCPYLQTLIIEDAFVAKHVNFTDITVEDLPQNLSILSLRESFFHTDQFFCSVSHPTVPKIQVLDCSYCWSITDADIPFFTRLTDLQELYLEGCTISDGGVSLLLTRVSNLKVLDLEGSEVTDNSLISLAECCRSLEKLFLGKTSTSDSALCELNRTSFPKLQTLCLIRTQVSDVGLRAVVSLPALKWLEVSGCKVTSECVLEVASFIPPNRKFILNYFTVLPSLTCSHFFTRNDNI